MRLKVLKYPDDEQLYRNFNKKQYRFLAQHSWGWQRMLATWEDLEWGAIGAIENDTEMIGCIPFCIKRTDVGNVLMSSPMPASYAGVLHVENIDKNKIYSFLLQELTKYAEKQEIDIITVFTSPFRDDLELYQQFLKPDYCISKFYQYIFSNGDILSKVNSKFRNNVKRNLNKATENTLNLEFMYNPGPIIISEWYNQVLLNRFNDIGVTPVEESFYHRLIDCLSDERLVEFAQIRHENKMISGGILLYGWCQDIFLRATVSEGLALGAGLYFDYYSFKRGEEIGVLAHNFQSSPSKEAPSYAYKQRWGCQEDNCYYFVKILSSSDQFIQAGKDQISKIFRYFFVLPYSTYENEGIANGKI